MTLACTKCESHYLIEDYDARMRMVTGYHCGMCGSTKLKDSSQLIADSKQSAESSQQLPHTANSSQLTANSPEVNMSHKLCEREGCARMVVKDHLCAKHYKEKHGDSPKKNYRKPCAIEGCTRQALAQGLCYHHLTEKYGGKNPYYYKKKKKQAQGTRLSAISEASSASFVEVAPNVLVPKETKALVDQINALQTSANPEPIGHAVMPPPVISMTVSATPLPILPQVCHCEERPGDVAISPLTASLSQQVYDLDDGFERRASIVFSYCDGSKVFAECRYETRNHTKYSYDDWMFLGAIASEIKRIAGEV